MEERCDNCFCSIAYDSQYYCRRFPPLPIATKEGCIGMLPPLQADGWCREWKLKKDCTSLINILKLSPRTVRLLSDMEVCTIEQLRSKFVINVSREVEPTEFTKTLGSLAVEEIRQKLIRHYRGKEEEERNV